MRPLSPRTMQVLEAMRFDELSLREIGARVGLSSTSTVHLHLQRLLERGLVVRHRYSRGYQVAVRPVYEPTLEPMEAIL